MNKNLSFRPLSSDEISEFFPIIYHETNDDNLLEDQFRWKYFEVPDSFKATVWGCFVGEELAGISTTLKREYYDASDGEKKSCQQLYDSFIRPNFQRQGIYKKQIQFLIDTFNSTGDTFIFAFTNHKSAGALKRYPNAQNLQSLKVRFFPIGSNYIFDRILHRKIPLVSPFVSFLIKTIAKLILAIGRDKKIQMKRIDSIDKINSIYESFSHHEYSVLPKRSKEFFNWKVFEVAPSIQEFVSFYEFYENSEYRGYCVLFYDKPNNRLKILDILCDDNKYLSKCLNEICCMALESGYDSVFSVTAGQSHQEAFSKCGFLKVGSARVSIIPLNAFSDLSLINQSNFLYLSPIDRDTFFY